MTFPLPSFGLLLNYNVTPRIQVQGRTDFFYLRLGDYEGVMFEFYAGLEYRLAAGLQDTSTGGFEIDVAYNLAYFYGTLYLF